MSEMSELRKKQIEEFKEAVLRPLGDSSGGLGQVVQATGQCLPYTAGKQPNQQIWPNSQPVQSCPYCSRCPTCGYRMG